MQKFIKVSVLSVFLATCSMADDAQSVGLNLGSIGGDIEYTRMVMPEYNLALRLGLGGFSYSGDYDDTDTHYDTDLSQFNLGATLEYHPFSSGFYIGAGVYYQNSSYEMEATPSGGEYEFGDHTYNALRVGTVTGSLTHENSLAPYLGVGYDASLFDLGSTFFTLSVGAAYQGDPKVSLKNKNCNLGTLGCNMLETDLRKEEKSINDDINGFAWWPSLQLGITYKF